MTKAAPVQKLALTAPQTIPLDKLGIHDGNVRQIKVGISIENLATDIARRGLLQSLSVRPFVNEAGEETGFYGVQAGGRRLRALQQLVKQKKLAKNAPVPCIVRTEGFVEADSLAENTEREALHPIDQFRAFAALRDKGQGEDTIAAAFGVTPAVVKQRLRLANASPLLLKAYEDDELTLEQLMAFCIVEDRKRQEEVWASLNGHWNSGPDAIRRMLTEKTARADDRRALFVGAEAYKEAGGIILRDLFAEDEDGWLQDVPLLEKLAGEKLTAEAGTIKAEGWGWVDAAIDFPWNHLRAYKPLKPVSPALSDEEEAEFEALSAEFEELDQTPVNELTDKAKDQLQIVRELIIHFENKSPVFDEAQKAIAGAFISLRDDGFLLIERGYIRREDEAAGQSIGGDNCDAGNNRDAELNATGSLGPQDASGDDEDDDAALPDRLMIELTAYRSLALREELANDPGMAYLTMLHALTLRLFYNYTCDTCLQVEAKHNLTSPFPGLADAPAAKAIEARHRSWQEALPERPQDLWDMLASLDTGSREALFAHCAGLTVNAVYEPHVRISGKRRHADQLAAALKLDMTEAGWVTRADNYLNRITKAQIIEAVREAKGDKTAELLTDLKKKEMALEAERLLDGTGWLPEPLRTPERLDSGGASDAELPAFLQAAE